MPMQSHMLRLKLKIELKLLNERYLIIRFTYQTLFSNYPLFHPLKTLLRNKRLDTAKDVKMTKNRRLLSEEAEFWNGGLKNLVVHCDTYLNRQSNSVKNLHKFRN